MKCQICREKEIDDDSSRAPICQSCFIELRGEKRKRQIFEQKMKEMKQVAESMRARVDKVEAKYLEELQGAGDIDIGDVGTGGIGVNFTEEELTRDMMAKV